MSKPKQQRVKVSNAKIMDDHDFHFRWQWAMKSSPEALWPMASDTNRFNLDVGLGPLTTFPVPQEEHVIPRRHLRIHILRSPFFDLAPMEWYEEPFEWVRPYRFGVVRQYISGPFKTMRTLTQLLLRSDGGTDLVYETWIKARNRIWALSVPVEMQVNKRRQFEAVFRKYDDLAQTQRPVYELQSMPPTFSAGGQERLRQLGKSLQRQMEAQDDTEGIAERVTNYLSIAPDLNVTHIRPYALARTWKTNLAKTVDAFLFATRLGMTDLQWDLICPQCRVAKVSADHLSELVDKVHCDTCQIDYEVNFERSVELTFRPNASIRAIEDKPYCLAGPQTTPHIVAQAIVPPQSTYTVTPSLEPGRYRMRALGMQGAQFMRVESGADVGLKTRVTGEWALNEPTLNQTPRLEFTNVTDYPQLTILERTAWADDVLTAADVTTRETFRDLFASEALRPGDQYSVGSLTVLFTDLCNSTQLYRQVGDARAFGLVLQHFDVLREEIAAADGAIVKTIGDAVMAVFRRPVNAVSAVMKAQERLLKFEGLDKPLLLKAGVHTGASIAVTLNERLDYFGTTINLAARLQSLSSGGDIIISESVYDDPDVQMLFRGEQGLIHAPLTATLKGFDREEFNLWLIVSTEALASSQS